MTPSQIDELRKEWKDIEAMEDFDRATFTAGMFGVKHFHSLLDALEAKTKEAEGYKEALKEIADVRCAGYCSKGNTHCSFPEYISKKALQDGGVNK